MPINRVPWLQSTQGIDTNRSTRIRCFELASNLCEVVEGEHWKKVLAGKRLHSDETWSAFLDVVTNGAVFHYRFVLSKRKEGVLIAICNAHPRHQFRDTGSAQPIRTKEAGPSYARMYVI